MRGSVNKKIQRSELPQTEAWQEETSKQRQGPQAGRLPTFQMGMLLWVHLDWTGFIILKAETRVYLLP